MEDEHEPAEEPTAIDSDPRKTVGELAEARGIDPGYWKLRVLNLQHGWNEQSLVTEEEFEAAMNEIDSQIIR